MDSFYINGRKLAFVDSGHGPALLLVHGWPLDHSMWDGQIKGLAARHRVIAPDLPGFGQSDLGGNVVEMWQYADDLAALLDFLKIDNVVYCGLSMGGYIAFEFWRRHAKLLGGLVLCDTRAASDTPEAAANRSVMAEKVLSEGSCAAADAMIPKLFAAVTMQVQPDVIIKIRQVIEGHDPRGIAAAALGMAKRADFRGELPHIGCPALVIVGEHDSISMPAEMQGMAGAIPDAEFAVIPQAGHMSPLEQPVPVNAAIERFLGRI
jgi:3-oxoadipate enol-lactonase